MSTFFHLTTPTRAPPVTLRKTNLPILPHGRTPLADSALSLSLSLGVGSGGTHKAPWTIQTGVSLPRRPPFILGP